MIYIPGFIQEAIQGGIRPTISDTWYAHMRYDEKHEVETIDDLKRLARHGMHGRDFISADWAEFLLTEEQRAERKLAYDALRKLTPEEQRAVKGLWV
jgi:hypothetical protein